jgi:acyl-CoA synthetase (AMP-forming)/AMP-acid ligase II
MKLKDYKNLLDAIAAAPPDAPFVTMWHGDQTPEYEVLTFREFMHLAQGYGSYYCLRGIRPGNTIVIAMPQGIPLMAAFVGALLVGAVPSILAYPTFKIDPEKYRHGLSGVTENLKASLVVFDEDFPQDLLEYLASYGDERLVQIKEPGAGGRQEEITWHQPGPDDVAFLQHSSGTTGLQKGVALTHGAVLRQLQALSESLHLTARDRIVSWLPLYHDMGLIACFILPLVCHLQVIMESPTYWVLRPGSMLHLATKFQATLCWLPNFSFQFLARRVHPEERGRLDLSSMRAIINCSERVRFQSMEEFYQAYRSSGLSRSALQTSYAMAENTFAVTQSRLDGTALPTTIWVESRTLKDSGRVKLVANRSADALPLTSSGTCLVDNFVKIIGQKGEPLEEGHLGEILVSSNSLFQGYYNRPDLTRKRLRAGWFRTGDTGLLWKGELYVLGRLDDLIIVGGKNIYPHDIEEIVASHPSIKDGRTVALGLFNPELGTQDLVIVAEVQNKGLLEHRLEIQNEIRRAILGEIGVAPRSVYLVPPKWIVKSTSGKLARSHNLEKLLMENPALRPAQKESASR